MEYMAQKMDELIESGMLLEAEMSELLEKVEDTLGVAYVNWCTIDPRKLMWTIIQLYNKSNNEVTLEDLGVEEK